MLVILDARVIIYGVEDEGVMEISMPEVHVKGSSTSGELRIELPEGWPDAEYDVVVRREESPAETLERQKRLRAALERLVHSGRRADPKTLDARIQELRDSWD